MNRHSWLKRTWRSLNLDLKAVGCDFYASSCHKWLLRPSGTGFLYVRREMLDTLQQKLLPLVPKIEMLTTTEARSRAGMVTIRIPGKDYMELATLATKNGFRIRAVPESNLKALRISTHIYNSFEEVDRFAAFTAATV